MHNYIHNVDSHPMAPVIGNMTQLILTILFAAGLMLYILFVFLSNRRYKKWPLSRTALWVVGIGCAFAAVAGPLAERAHADFTVHMLGHLLLGMLAPLLMALAAPITLVMRTIKVSSARKLSRALRSRPIRLMSDPITASLLNMGGLWVLYTTDLIVAMHHQASLYVFIHLHIFLAGYLFTASISYTDPAPHRRSYVYRCIVLVLALAAHGIVSKHIYAHPPAGVPDVQAEAGGMLMYYGGDAIDVILVYLLCFRWYKDTLPRENMHMIMKSSA